MNSGNFEVRIIKYGLWNTGRAISFGVCSRIGQDDKTNLECVSLYILSYYIKIFSSSSTLLFSEMRGQFISQKISEY